MHAQIGGKKMHGCMAQNGLNINRNKIARIN